MQPLLKSVPASLDGLREAVLAVAGELAGESSGKAGARGGVVLERPPRADFGDYSTNAALLLAPGLGAPPREVAVRAERPGSASGGGLEREGDETPAAGTAVRFSARVRIDTPREAEYYRHGGILQYVLRALLAA